MYAIRETLPISKKRFRMNKSVLLILGLLLMYLFIAIGLPFLSQIVGFTEEHQVIIDEDIHAGEWFYIFVEQIREIEPRFRDTLKYSPGM